MPTQLSITDARKYVNDVDSNLNLKLTTGTAQGNFKTVQSIFNWLKYNNNFNGNAILRNATSINGTVVDTLLDFKSHVVIDGENECDIILNGITTIGSNFTLKNLNLTINDSIVVIAQNKDVVFDNCNITINTYSNTGSNTVFNFISASNIKFKNTNVVIEFKIAVPQYSGGTLFKFSDTNNFEFTNSSVLASYNVNYDDKFPGNIFEFINCENVNIYKSRFDGNFLQCAIFEECEGVSIKDSYIRTEYAINVSSNLGYLGYDDRYNINSGHAIVQFKCESLVKDIKIDNVDFNFYADNIESTFNRFSYIDFNLVSDGSKLDNVLVNGCRFTSVSNSPISIDYMPAITIINEYGGESYASDIRLSNNICNSKQSIVITSKIKLKPATGSLPNYYIMEGSSIVPTNVNITGNTCGVIGYWTANNMDNTSELIIDRNKCGIICNIDNNGYFFSTIDSVSSKKIIKRAYYESSNVTIDRNNTSWIFTSISYDNYNKKVKISNNNLRADNKSLLIKFRTSSNNYSIVPSSSDVLNIAIHVACDQISSYQNVDIIGNNISGSFILGNYYNYSNSCIYSFASCNISDNIISGIDSVDDYFGGNSIISFCGRHSIVKNNCLYRNGSSVSSYISFRDYMFEWDGISKDASTDNGTLLDLPPSGGIISGNKLDSPYIHEAPYPMHSKGEIGLYDEEKVIVVPLYDVSKSLQRGVVWIVNDNKNQTAQCALSTINSTFQSSTDYLDSSVTTTADSLDMNLAIKTCQISKYLPVGSKVVSVHSSILCNKNVGRGFTLTLYKYKQNSNYIINYFDDNTINKALSVYYSEDSQTGYSKDTPMILRLDCIVASSDSGYLKTADPTYSPDSDYAIVGAGYEISCSIKPNDIINKTDSTSPSDDINLITSPLFVKYRY